MPFRTAEFAPADKMKDPYPLQAFLDPPGRTPNFTPGHKSFPPKIPLWPKDTARLIISLSSAKLEVLLLPKATEISNASLFCQSLRVVKVAWARSSLTRWLQRKPLWFAVSPTLFQKTRDIVQHFNLTRHAADGAKSCITGSRLLQPLAEKAWLLLFVLGAYPLIDFATRRFGGNLGGLTGAWDELCLLLGLSLIAARVLNKGPESYRRSELDLPLFLYFGAFLFLFFIRSPETAVGTEGVRVYLQYALWFFVGLNLPDNYRQVKSFTSFFVLVCAVIAAYGIGQYIAGVPIPGNWLDQAEAGVRTRAFSVIGSPNVLGALLSLALPMGVAGFYTAGSRRSRTGYAVATALMAVCLVMTFSRGAWLAAFFGLALFALLARTRLLCGLGAAVLLAPVVFPGIAGRIMYLFSADYLASSERAGRIARWQAALDRLQLHPLTGEGFGRFGGAVATRAIPGSFYVDNFYLKTAAEGGVLAFFTLLWVIFCAWRAGYRSVAASPHPSAKMLAAAFLGGLTAVLLHNAVENIFEVPLMSTLFWLVLGLLLALPHLSSPASQ